MRDPNCRDRANCAAKTAALCVRCAAILSSAKRAADMRAFNATPEGRAKRAAAAAKGAATRRGRPVAPPDPQHLSAAQRVFTRLDAISRTRPLSEPEVGSLIRAMKTIDAAKRGAANG